MKTGFAIALLALFPLLADAEHATINLSVFRGTDATSEAAGASDQEPPPGGVRKREALKVKANEPLTLQFVYINTYPHGVTKDVTIRWFVVRQEKLGQKLVPELKSGVVVQGHFNLNFKPKGRVGARVAFKVPEPGVYLLRVDSLNTNSDHEHFAAIDLEVE
ncbi:MAG: hypothetical protein U0793_00725 [Gemmataceae bacterium]